MEVLDVESCKEKKINSKFRWIGKSVLDSKNRITLGGKVTTQRALAKMEIDSFEIYMDEEGDILLCPLANIPGRELWVHQNPEVMSCLQRGLKEAKEGKVTRVEDLDKFFDTLSAVAI